MKKGLLSILLLSLISCGGGGSDNSLDGKETVTGVLVDAPVAGVEYRCSEKVGYTGENGEYECVEESLVEFYIGKIKLGQATVTEMLTPIDLVGTNIDSTDKKSVSLMQLLQTLDYDNNPSNGIVITETIRENAKEINIDFTDDSSVESFLSNADTTVTELIGVYTTLVDSSEALQHFYQTIQDVTGEDYCLIKNDYSSFFGSSTSTCTQRMKRHAFAELLNPIATSQIVLQNQLNSGTYTDAQSFREGIIDNLTDTIKNAKKVNELYHVYQAAKKVGKIKEAAFDEGVNYASEKAYDYAATGIGEAFGNEEYGKIWGDAIKVILEGGYAISQGEVDIAFEKTVEYAVERAVKASSDFYFSYKLNFGVQKVHELEISREIVRQYYKYYEDQNYFMTGLGLEGSFSWEKIINSIAPKMQCGDHNCVDGGIITGDDYQTENVIELVISSLDLINSSINEFNILQTPQGLKAEITDDFQGVNLTWSFVPNADYYHLYWLSDLDKGWNVVPFITTTNYTHYYDDSSATYHYKLVAINDDGSSSLNSGVITFIPSNPIDSPTNVAANLVDLGQAIRVSWDAVEGATSYELQWSEKKTSDAWNTISNLATTTYDHYFNDVRDTYSYKVVTLNANGVRSDESEIIIFSPSTVNNDLNKDLIAHYEFESTGLDTSSNGGYYGIESGEVLYNNGIIGQSINLSGNSHLSISRSYPNDSINRGLTFSFWAKVVNPSRSQVVISQYNWSYTGHVYSVSFESSKLTATYYTDLSGHNSLKSDYSDAIKATITQPEQWNHYVINSLDNKLQIWVNGVLTNEEVKGSAPYVSNSSIQTYIGHTGISGNGNDRHFIGEIDDLRIYNRGLMSSEISALSQL